jgi:hypothetical protein
LQPLDFGVFSSLQSAYSNAVNCIRALVNRNNFPNLLVEARKKAMTPKNILNGFRKTSIHPYDLQQRYKRLRKPEAFFPRTPKSSPSPPSRLLTTLTATTILSSLSSTKDTSCLEMISATHHARQPLPELTIQCLAAEDLADFANSSHSSTACTQRMKF